MQDLPYFAEQCLLKISLFISQLRLWPELSLDLQDARPLWSLAALVQSCQCMHRALACCQALATHARLALPNQLKNVRVDLDEGFLLFCALVGSVYSNFSQRLLEEAPVERINDCEEEVALDVVLAFIGRVCRYCMMSLCACTRARIFSTVSSGQIGTRTIMTSCSMK